MTQSAIIEEEGMGRLEVFPLETTEENLFNILSNIFENYWDQVVFGPLVQGAVFEIHAPNAPTKINMLDGYLTVNFGSWHFHMCIGPHKGNRTNPTSPELARQRRCQRAEMYRILNSDNSPRSWGMRFFNGKDEQMMTVFFPNPFISNEERILRTPDWSRLNMWNEFRQKYIGLAPDPQDQTCTRFRCGGHQVFGRLICGGLLSAAVSLLHLDVYADKPQHIVSLSVCADQYLLGLVAPERIAALSEDARDPQISLYHKKAEKLATTRGNAEEVLLLKPDLVIANRWRGTKTIEILRQSGIKVLMLSLPVTFENIQAETRMIAKTLGETEKGEILLKDLQQATRHHMNLKTAPRAAYFMPGGYSAGQNTFVETVLHAAGYRNLASELGLQGWSSLSLEQLILEQPDLLVMSFFSQGHHSLSTRLRQHSAMKELMKMTPVIDVPEKYWSCGGWFLFEAINYLKRQTI